MNVYLIYIGTSKNLFIREKLLKESEMINDKKNNDLITSSNKPFNNDLIKNNDNDFNNNNCNPNLISDFNKNEDHENFKKIENAASALQILLKVFSDEQMNYFLKKKFGENYHLKLTDKEIDSQFLNKINNEVIHFDEKENFKLNNFDMKEINKCIKTLSPKQFDFSGEYHSKKKPFNNLTKKYPSFFNSNNQYGSESEIFKKRHLEGFSCKKDNSKSCLNKSDFTSKIGNNINIYNYIDEKENLMNEENKRFNCANNELSRSKELRKNKKLNYDFFINSEITNDLLRRPIRIGVESISNSVKKI